MGFSVGIVTDKIVDDIRGEESDTVKQVRIAAEENLSKFIKLVAPHRVLGSCHEELLAWWTREDAKSHQLTLLPRDHQKSAMVAYRVAWHITKNPDTRILYISSTARLAQQQIKFIKDILTSKIYRRYWPEMTHVDEGKRAKWSATEFEVDHPLRSEEGVRDPTVFTAGLTTNIVGMHCDVAIFDDLVVPQNAYTQEGRKTCETQYGFLSSIETGDAMEWVVGTLYHPKDLYEYMMNIKVEMFGTDGELISEDPLHETFRREVESSGDGTGEFLWPRQQRSYDNKWFGFDQAILARKRAQYPNKSQFRSQYYNDPNDPEGSGIGSDQINYYERKFLNRHDGYWYFKQARLNVFASIDFAFSLRKGSDFTAIVVLGIDSNHNYYVLDIVRFKTDLVSEYFKHILELHQKWGFRKIRAEVTVAQATIVSTLKNEYIKPYGLSLSVEEYRPTRHEGNKQERIKATLEPRYQNGQMWHYFGGNCQILEEELSREHSSHDDVKDALASVIEIAVAPMRLGGRGLVKKDSNVYHTRFGGLAR